MLVIGGLFSRITHQLPRASSPMPLGSVLQTALSGMSAATATFDAVGHNVANMRTNGYKAVQPVFATQTPTTRNLGAGPTAGRGGHNPAQIGTGVRLVGFETDLTPGPLIAARNTSPAWGDDAKSTGVVELSSVDLGDELVNLFLGSNHFRASARFFGESSRLFDALVQLRRRSFGLSRGQGIALRRLAVMRARRAADVQRSPGARSHRRAPWNRSAMSA